MFSHRELEVLENFKTGKRVETEDEPVINKMLSLGIVKTGIHMQDGKPIPTSILTNLGYRLVRREKIRTSPFLRFWHSLLHI